MGLVEIRRVRLVGLVKAEQNDGRGRVGRLAWLVFLPMSCLLKSRRGPRGPLLVKRMRIDALVPEGAVLVSTSACSPKSRLRRSRSFFYDFAQFPERRAVHDCQA
jgi:hypothetical protein